MCAPTAGTAEEQRYFTFCNTRRPQSSLDRMAPDQFYFAIRAELFKQTGPAHSPT
jgi:hypothetical protein